jgi:hypothetical protein
MKKHAETRLEDAIVDHLTTQGGSVFVDYPEGEAKDHYDKARALAPAHRPSRNKSAPPAIQGVARKMREMFPLIKTFRDAGNARLDPNPGPPRRHPTRSGPVRVRPLRAFGPTMPQAFLRRSFNWRARPRSCTL